MQNQLEKRYYLNNLDYKDWIRYYEIIKSVLKYDSRHILDLGTGSGFLTKALMAKAESLILMDYNDNLEPDIVGDIREYQPVLERRFDTVIASEILEHVKLHEVRNVMDNIYQYLIPRGKVIITVPHKNPFISICTVLNTDFPLYIIIPRIRKKVPVEKIDKYHCWEIGYGAKTKEVEAIFKSSGFTILEYKNIPHHDYWVLSK